MRDQAWIDAKRAARMGSIDALPADIRALVHEYGLNVVRALMDSGVTRAKNIRHVVETVLDEFSPTRGSCSAQGPSLHHDPIPPHVAVRPDAAHNRLTSSAEYARE